MGYALFRQPLSVDAGMQTCENAGMRGCRLAGMRACGHAGMHTLVCYKKS